MAGSAVVSFFGCPWRWSARRANRCRARLARVQPVWVSAVSLPLAVASGCRGEGQRRTPADRTAPNTAGERRVLPRSPTSTANKGAQRALADLLRRRRSQRSFARRELSAAQLSLLLWSAQGITERKQGLRTAPSAGALYPLVIYVVAGRVADLKAGVYRYDATVGRLDRLGAEDRRASLARRAQGQGWIDDAPAILVITGSYRRTAEKYGERARRYVHIEAGHAAQNLCLMATALDLATTPVGAFDDERIARLLELPPDLVPLLLLPVGPSR